MYSLSIGASTATEYPVGDFMFAYAVHRQQKYFGNISQTQIKNGGNICRTGQEMYK